MAEPSLSDSSSLSNFCRELQRLRIQSGRPTLESLGALDGSRKKSQLGEMFAGKIRVPPDRDLVKLLVEHFLRRAQRRNMSLAVAQTAEEWLARYDKMVLDYEREQLQAASTEVVQADLRPFMVPALKAGFVGRSAELRQLDDLLSRATNRDPRPVVISALAGTAGVGKTALAERWANLVRTSFPDGILYANLRGFHSEDRVIPREVAALFLRRLGVERKKVPYNLADRMDLLNKILAGRSVLVIYDNAADPEHVRPLLLDQPTCLTLVTSRDSMDGLVVNDGAIRIELDRLTLGQSIELLRVHIGTGPDIDDLVLAELAVACVRLPLALRIAAETISKFPKRPVWELLHDLHDEQRRLDVFDSRDPEVALRSVFSWSYNYLAREEARTFRSIGIHPGSGDVDSYSIAAILGVRSSEAKRCLDILARSYLV